MAQDVHTAWTSTSGQNWVELQDVLDRLFRPLEAALVEEVKAGRPGRVLDIGCGAGATTVALARAAEGRCMGIDISEAMVGAARERARREESAATFACADAQTYAFEPESFDWLVSRFGVMFFADFVEAFRNLGRAAAPGGEMRFVTWRSPEENPFMTAGERAARPLLPELPPRDPNAPGQFGLADPEKIRAVLEQSGWREAELRPVEFACAMAEPDLERYFTRLGPVGMVLPQVDAERRRQVIDVMRAAFEPFVHGGEVRFTAACWLIRARRS